MTFVKRTEVRFQWCLSSSLGRLRSQGNLRNVWRLVPLAGVTWTPPVVLKPLQRHTCFPRHFFSSYQNMSPTCYILISHTDECQTVLSPSSPSHNNGKFVASEDHGMVHAAAFVVLAKPCPSLGCSEESWTEHNSPVWLRVVVNTSLGKFLLTKSCETSDA